MTPEQHIDTVRQLTEVRTDVKGIASDISIILKTLEVLKDVQIEVSRIGQEQQDHKEAIKRAFARIENTEKSSLEIRDQTNKWINRGIGSIATGAVLITFIQYLIFNKVQTYEKTQANHGDAIVSMDRRISWAEYEIKEGKKK